jgi:hypothetical protein
MEELTGFWSRCDLRTAPFAHPDDWPILRRRNGRYIDEERLDFEEFLRSSRFGAFEDDRLHLSLLPVPYVGDLQRADIVVLLLNPGFGFVDHYFTRYHAQVG